MGRSRQSGGEHRQQRKTTISRQDSRDGKADEGGRVVSCVEIARREEEAGADSVELARREEEASAGRETVTRESKGSIVS